MLNYYDLGNDYCRCSAIQAKKDEYFKRYNFGIEQEEKLKTKLEDFFNVDLIQKDRYAPFDFFSNNGDLQLELKSRKCKSNTYPTTLINKSKLGKVGDVETYFIFNFLDGVYYIKYDEKVFNTFKETETYTKNCDFSKGKRINIEIPVNLLLPLN